MTISDKLVGCNDDTGECQLERVDTFACSCSCSLPALVYRIVLIHSATLSLGFPRLFQWSPISLQFLAQTVL